MSRHSAQPRRLACDICHRQKLRCKISDTGTACERCLRTGRACNWSPPSRNGRPPKKQQQISSAHSIEIDSILQSHTLSTTENNANMDTTFFDFNFLDFHGGLALPTPDEPMSLPSLQETVDPAQECIRQLSMLQEDMYQVQNSMLTGFWSEAFESPQSVLERFSNPGINPEQCRAMSYPLDRLFMAAQKFIELIKEFFTPPLPSSVHHTETQNSEEVKVKLDLPMALVLVSCYVRLLQLFNTLYLQTYNMLVALTSPEGEKRLQELTLPREVPYLRFGTFQPPQPEVLKMQLVLQVGNQMLKRIERHFRDGESSFQAKLSTILKPEIVANILASESLKDAESGTSLPANISIVYGNSAKAAAILSKLADL